MLLMEKLEPLCAQQHLQSMWSPALSMSIVMPTQVQNPFQFSVLTMNLCNTLFYFLMESRVGIQKTPRGLHNCDGTMLACFNKQIASPHFHAFTVNTFVTCILE